MKNYFEAHAERMQRNNDQLISLAKEVLSIDNSIEIYSNRNEKLSDGLIFIKGENINTIQFHEVPYHWSGCGYTDHGGGENISMPFDAQDVLNTFKPIKTAMWTYKEPFKNRAQYLDWYSYLELINDRILDNPEIKTL